MEGVHLFIRHPPQISSVQQLYSRKRGQQILPQKRMRVRAILDCTRRGLPIKCPIKITLMIYSLCFKLQDIVVFSGYVVCTMHLDIHYICLHAYIEQTIYLQRLKRLII